MSHILFTFLLAALLTICTFTTSCTSTATIDAPPAIQAAIRDKRVVKGMTREQVRASWGEPFGVTGDDDWLYHEGGRRQGWSSNLSDPSASGPIRFNYSGQGSESQDFKVAFQADRVIDIVRSSAGRPPVSLLSPRKAIQFLSTLPPSGTYEVVGAPAFPPPDFGGSSEEWVQQRARESNADAIVLHSMPGDQSKQYILIKWK